MKKISFFVVALGLLISCKNDGKNEPEVKSVDAQSEIHESASTEVKFKDPEVGEAYEQYINLKTALVNSDVEKSREAAKHLAGILENNKSAREAREIAMKIADVPDLKAQREVFQYLTETMIEMVKGQFSSGNIYVQYCPMAFNDQGAYWLSNTKEIRNPYFGDKMLKCGEVKDVLQ